MATRSRARTAKRLVVALDGPASSGKSSVGAAAAAQLGMRFVDTGLFYRALTALALREDVAAHDVPALVALVTRVSLGDGGDGRLTRVLLDGEDATDEARGPVVDASVSAYASVPEVRGALLERQRELAAEGAIVVAGRDIGTVVLPDADLKLFLDASVEERATRRIEERGLDPAGAEAEEVREQLRRRDEIDSTRAVAPLRAADDAVHVRTDGNIFDETVEIVAAEIARVMLNPPARPSRSRARASRVAAVAAAREPASAPVPAFEPEPEPEPAPPEPAPASEREPEPEPAPPPAPRPVRRVTPAPPVAKRSSVIERAMQLDNDKSLLVRLYALIGRILGRAVARVEVHGLEHIPRTGAVILAANHLSNADPVVVGSWITDALTRRRIHWLGKRELFDWPVIGLLASFGGIHPVDRAAADVEAFRLATRILEKGYVLLVFPEGTRSPTAQLQEAKDGVAMLAMRTGAAIVPIGINNTDAVWKRGQALPLPRPRRTITVRIGRPFTIAEVLPEGIDRRAAKGLATTAIMGRIAEQLDPRHRGVYAGAVRTPQPPES